MKISNEFFIEQVKTAQMLSEANAIADETTIVYAVVIGDHTIMSVYGDKDKALNTCFTILEEIFNRHPSDFMPAMMTFIEYFINNHSSEKIEGDPS